MHSRQLLFSFNHNKNRVLDGCLLMLPVLPNNEVVFGKNDVNPQAITKDESALNHTIVCLFLSFTPFRMQYGAFYLQIPLVLENGVEECFLIAWLHFWFPILWLDNFGSSSFNCVILVPQIFKLLQSSRHCVKFLVLGPCMTHV